MLKGIINLRSKITKVPYGDQSIFVRKDIFKKIGGYDEKLVLMEDPDLSERLNRAGKLFRINNSVVSSERRFEKAGIVGYLLLCKFISRLYAVYKIFAKLIPPAKNFKWQFTYFLALVYERLSGDPRSPKTIGKN